MKATVYLHIGMHKTGTTSIQATLFKNRQRLLQDDINYFALNQNHSETIYSLCCDRPHDYHINRSAGIDTEEKAARRNAEIDVALRRELEANTCSRFVISGEDLLQLKLDGIARLKRKLEPFAAGYQVVVYVREPYAYVNSAFQQRVRAGATFDQLIAHPPVPRYRRIRTFIEAFGRERVDIRIFEPARLVHGDLIADFLTAIGANPELARTLKVVRANEALCNEAALILNEVNKRYPRTQDGGRNPDRAVDLPQLLTAVSGQRFRCPDAALAAAAPEITAQLRWLRAVLGERVFEDEPGGNAPSPDWSAETLASLAFLINDLANARANTPKRRRWETGVAFLPPALERGLRRWTKAVPLPWFGRFKK